MRSIVGVAFVLCSQLLLGQSNSDLIKGVFAKAAAFELAAPQLTYSSTLFQDTVQIIAQLNQEGIKLNYTIDGSEPTSKSLLYSKTIVLSKSTTFKIKAFHPDLLPSQTKTINFLKVKKTPTITTISLTHQPSPSYAGKGAKGLVDLQKGSTNFRTPYWLGFNGDDAIIDIVFEKKQKFQQITLSTLTDVGSWIFPPTAIEIGKVKRKGKYKVIHTVSYPKLKKASPKKLSYLSLSLKKQKLKRLRITIKNTGDIPDWHDGRGTPAWLFLDEIIFN